MHKKASRGVLRRKTSMPYVTSEMSAIIQRVCLELGDDSIAESIHFSSTALTVVRHVMMSGGTIVVDTGPALSGVDLSLARKLGIHVRCYIDNPRVVYMAEQRHVTRAQVALDHALDQPGLKLIAVGSAPAALHRLLQRSEQDSLQDVVTLAAPTGFASVVQLKERLWESNLASIVVRGKKGGTNILAAILNALMAESVRQQNL